MVRMDFINYLYFTWPCLYTFPMAKSEHTLPYMEKMEALTRNRYPKESNNQKYQNEQNKIEQQNESPWAK